MVYLNGIKKRQMVDSFRRENGEQMGINRRSAYRALSEKSKPTIPSPESSVEFPEDMISKVARQELIIDKVKKVWKH